MDRGEILKEASRLTYGSRNENHGHPYDNHRRIGIIMGVILEGWMKEAKPGDPIPPYLAAQLMVGMKLARLSYQPDHLDSAVDLAAYAAIAGELAGME